MEIEKALIKDRNGENISILIEKQRNKGTVLLMQGMGEVKNEPCLQTIAQCFQNNGYTTIRFDTAYTYDNNGLKFENFTVSHYYQCLEDVIGWLREREWYKDPLILMGYSLGGLCTILYAEKFPERIKAIFLVSATISCKLSLETFPPKLLTHWEKEGVFEWEDQGRLKRLNWNFVNDFKQFDTLPLIGNLASPVFMVSTENDNESPLEHQEILFQMIPTKKQQKIILGAPHKIKEQIHLDQIKNIFNDWITGL